MISKYYYCNVNVFSSSWWGHRFAFPPRCGLLGLRPAVSSASPSSKGARRSRSLDAREASPLRNATAVVCRYAAIVYEDASNCLLRLRQAGLEAALERGAARTRRNAALGRGGPRPVAETGRRAAAEGGAPIFYVWIYFKGKLFVGFSILL